MLSKILSQSGAPTRDARSYSSHGSLGCCCHFFVRESFYITEYDCCSLIEREALQSPLNQILKLLRKQALFRIIRSLSRCQHAEDIGGMWIIFFAEGVKRFCRASVDSPPVIGSQIGGNAQ